MSNHDKQFSSFKHTTFLNGQKINDKQIQISINPDNKQQVYAYLKQNNDQYLYNDQLQNFYDKIRPNITSKSHSEFDLIQLLKSDLESLKSFNKLDKIKFKKISQLSKKYSKKKFKNLI